MSVAILNTDANITGKTLVTAEGTDTITGIKTYSRGASAPFAVAAGASSVANLDADKVDGKHSSDIILADGTTAMSSTLNLTSGQIAFPAVQSASAGVNTLDDYEEGSWTATLVSSGGGAPTYTRRTGYYTKIGNLVQAQLYLTLASLGTLAAGNLTITGLPFGSKNQTDGYSVVCCPYWASMTTALSSLGGFINPNASSINLVRAAAATVSTGNLTVADLAGTSEFMLNVNYQTA